MAARNNQHTGVTAGDRAPKIKLQDPTPQPVDTAMNAEPQDPTPQPSGTATEVELQVPPPPEARRPALIPRPVSFNPDERWVLLPIGMTPEHQHWVKVKVQRPRRRKRW